MSESAEKTEQEKLGIDVRELEKQTNGRYEFQKILGHGAYGIVYAAADVKTGKRVAIKQVSNIFDNLLNAQRILREIKILENIRHENITNLIDVYCPKSFHRFNSITFVVDLMDTDLYQIIASHQELDEDHRRYFMYQILRGMKYIHSANILHRDLKPSNILVNKNCDLKICDFGLARVQQKGHEISEYVTTRWYRAPEVLMGYDHTDYAMDIWSVGCIFAELILRKPFFPGKSTLNQLSVIIQKIGSPTREDLRECKSKKVLRFIKKLKHKDPIVWEETFPEASPEEIDLLKKMFCWDPTKRTTADVALKHKYFRRLHDPKDEPMTFPLDEFEFEKENARISELKELLWKEYKQYHPG